MSPNLGLSEAREADRTPQLNDARVRYPLSVRSLDGSTHAADSKVWDVIVIGAGPAGSSAARAAANGGASVLLLDRAVFPRYKTCGGGIVGESEHYIPDSALWTIEQRVNEVFFTNRQKWPVRHHEQTPFLGMVRREEFDQALVDEAKAAGVRFCDGESARGISEADGVVTVRTSTRKLAARVVIGADGTSGRVGRYVGVDCERVDLGLEYEIQTTPSREDLVGKVLLDWGKAPGSYAWVFPKRDSLTVGVIQRKGHPDQTRAYLYEWVRHLGLDAFPVVTSSGHLTQWRKPGSPLRLGSVLVTGDAAGLLEPWTREGISFALRSGTWAGEAAARAVSGAAFEFDLESYENRVKTKLSAEQMTGAAILRAFERHPGLFQALLSNTHYARRFFVRFCRGETSLAFFSRHRMVLKLTRALGFFPHLPHTPMS